MASGSLDEIPRPKDMPFELPENIDPDVYLLVGDPGLRTRTLLGNYWLTIATAGLALGGSILNCAVNKRPLSSGLHKHIIFTLAGGVAGSWMHRYKEQSCAERDLQFLHYISLHPEDFEAPKRVLYRDYLTHWNPIR